jgi:large subunit ribosomal protein L18e
MTMKRDTKNIEKISIINKLYETSKLKKKDVYKRVAEIINCPTRNLPAVNLFKLEKLDVVKDGSIVIIPGKLLGTGVLKKKITIYAYNFSESTKKNVKAKSLIDLCKDTIDYKKVLIIK